MIIKELKLVWAKRETKEFDIKKNGKKQHIKTDEKLWLSFEDVTEEDVTLLEKLFDKLERKYPYYEKEDGSKVLTFSSKYDIPCIVAIDGQTEKGNFEEFTTSGKLLTKNLICDISVNDDNGYIKAIKVTKNGEPYGNPFDDFEDVDLPF